jgi:Domain of unknown function (DUF4383)
MYLAHIPVNHHLRPLYRLLAALAGLYLVGFGVFALIESSGQDVFARDGLPTVLGQQVNPAQAVLDIALGAVVLVVTGLGRNIDAYANFWVGHLLVAIALAMLTVLRTDANILGFNMPTTIVTMVVGLVVLTAAMYSKVGPDRPADAEQRPSRHAATAAG